ncbi:MAG: DUF1573 domain-containing protein [Phycisphaerales bacterium]|nr:DUF1573 domain-containing protein [Phycisphaerales bacterium]
MKKHLWVTSLAAAALTLGVAVAQDAKPAEPKQEAPKPAAPAPAQPKVEPGHEGHDHAAPPPAPSAPVDPNAPAPKIELSETVWNFGTLWAGMPADKEITIKNVGQGPMNVSVRTSCGCTQAKKPKDVLQPGESDTMKISYSTKKKPGKVSQTVTIQTNDPANPQATVKVEGEVKPVYTAEPGPYIQFGRLSKSSKDTQKITIKNEYTDKLNLKMKDKPEGPFDIELKEIEPGMKYELTATSRPPLTMGVVKADVKLETGVELLPEIDISVQGYVQPPVMVNPAQLWIPPQTSQPTERIIRVTYVTDKPVNILGIKSSADVIKAELQPKTTTAPAGVGSGSHDIRVKLPAGSEIPESGATIEITTDSEDPEYRLLKVDVTTKRPTPAVPAVPGGAKPGAPMAPTTPAAPAPPAGSAAGGSNVKPAEPKKP